MAIQLLRLFNQRVHTCATAVVLLLTMSTTFVQAQAITFDCGNGQTQCSVNELANYLDRIKDTFEAHDYLYDQIYADGETTIVFVQRILHSMDRLQREHVKAHGANKVATLPELCAQADLIQILDQGLILTYIINDFDRNLINRFTIERSDCQN